MNNKILLIKVEVNSGRYLPSHKAVKKIYTNFTGTEVNNMVTVYSQNGLRCPAGHDEG